MLQITIFVGIVAVMVTFFAVVFYLSEVSGVASNSLEALSISLLITLTSSVVLTIILTGVWKLSIAIAEYWR